MNLGSVLVKFFLFLSLHLSGWTGSSRTSRSSRSGWRTKQTFNHRDPERRQGEGHPLCIDIISEVTDEPCSVFIIELWNGKEEEEGFSDISLLFPFLSILLLLLVYVPPPFLFPLYNHLLLFTVTFYSISSSLPLLFIPPSSSPDLPHLKLFS